MFLPQLSRPVLPAERYHVPSQIKPSRAEAIINNVITDGTFRPPDAADKARIEEAFALYVPFWRVDIQRADTAIRFAQVRVGSLGVPIPHESSSEAKATWMVCARTAFPYEMKHPSTLIAGDAKALVVSLAALEHGEPDTYGGWELLDADVDERKAKEIANASLSRSSSNASGLFRESEVTVHAMHFVRYPIWFARYRYRGAASADGNDLFYVGISAVDGEPITAEHPSKLRAGAAKVKKFLGID
jgi:hypothetical protein